LNKQSQWLWVFLLCFWLFKVGLKVVKTMGWFRRQKKYLKVIFNCYCPRCKKYHAERIAVRDIGFMGFNCSCGFKEKANWKRIDYFSKTLL